MTGVGGKLRRGAKRKGTRIAIDILYRYLKIWIKIKTTDVCVFVCVCERERELNDTLSLFSPSSISYPSEPPTRPCRSRLDRALKQGRSPCMSAPALNLFTIV